MTSPTNPTASYRFQLRNGVGFAEIEDQLERLSWLGVSHLYLSPIFLATKGSSHGYDVIDPTRIEPCLGGREGFERLAHAAQARGLGIILDIVPNHAAFSPQSPWLADVLRHGRDSRYAGYFDLDWQAPAIVLPFLPRTFDEMLDEGAFSIEGDEWVCDALRLPLAPGTENIADLRQAHEAQHWRLVRSDLEGEAITHRRFFDITDLIGLRVEDPQVFAATHALIVDLVRAGLVQGLRVDHVDGLVDPQGYLDRLASAVPGIPVWVEKILAGDEALPAGWNTRGTTGYDAARLIVRLLTEPDGLGRLEAMWRQATGIDESFAEALAAAKHDILGHELAAERRQLIELAGQCRDGSNAPRPEPEALSQAITALLVAMPRYRSYVTVRGTPPEDRTLLRRLAQDAARDPKAGREIDWLGATLAGPGDAAALAFAARFQQISGALLAKAQEDTAGFRWTRYLAANEVGAEPDETTITPAAASRCLARLGPGGMTLTSSHDTKRSEDARMRLTAISHLPESYGALHAMACALPEARSVSPRWIWYVTQSAVAIWGADQAAERLADHMAKAMREAKLRSFWTNPDEPAETAAQDLATALLRHWDQTYPQPLQSLVARSGSLVLAQLLFKCLMPGFPDFYQGSENLFLALTDPDNRRPVDRNPAERREGALGTTKTQWTRALLHLRRQRADFFETASARVERRDNGLCLIRQRDGDRLIARIGAPDHQHDEDELLGFQGDDDCRVSLFSGQGDPSRR